MFITICTLDLIQKKYYYCNYINEMHYAIESTEVLEMTFSCCYLLHRAKMVLDVNNVMEDCLNEIHCILCDRQVRLNQEKLTN